MVMEERPERLVASPGLVSTGTRDIIPVEEREPISP